MTLKDLPLKGSIPDDQLGIIENAGLLVRGDHVIDVGGYAQLLDKADDLNAEKVHIDHEAVCLPSYIDAHTHICFAGSRARDYAMRNAGASYLDIARAGGGIWDTVQNTRKADEAQLLEGILHRIDRLNRQGVTTIEIKSGYGLSIEDELKMLNAIKKASSEVATDLMATCLAAHIKPKDFEGNHRAYLEHMAEDLLPKIKEQALASRVDIFIEEEAFSKDISRDYLKKAMALGFDITIHADQFHTGGSALAVELGARSADHLEASTDKEIKLLAHSDVVAMALPGASIGLGCAFTPARKLLDSGACLAIATDWNPGSAPMGNLMVQACVLATYEKLSNAEVLSALTFRAAHALGLNDRGRLEINKLADFNIYYQKHYNEIFYHQGMIQPDQVWKSGQRIL